MGVRGEASARVTARVTGKGRGREVTLNCAMFASITRCRPPRPHVSQKRVLTRHVDLCAHVTRGRGDELGA